MVHIRSDVSNGIYAIPSANLTGSGVISSGHSIMLVDKGAN